MKSILFGLITVLTMGVLSGCDFDDTIMPKADVDVTSDRYWVGYTCANAFALEVIYDNRDQGEPTAAFFITGELTEAQINPGVMSLLPSASGAKYSDGKYVWWTKGNEAFLADASDAENMILSDCVEVPSIEGQPKNATFSGIYNEKNPLLDGVTALFGDRVEMNSHGPDEQESMVTADEFGLIAPEDIDRVVAEQMVEIEKASINSYRLSN